jgi:hypothetical protein
MSTTTTVGWSAIHWTGQGGPGPPTPSRDSSTLHSSPCHATCLLSSWCSSRLCRRRLFHGYFLRCGHPPSSVHPTFKQPCCLCSTTSTTLTTRQGQLFPFTTHPQARSLCVLCRCALTRGQHAFGSSAKRGHKSAQVAPTHTRTHHMHLSFKVYEKRKVAETFRKLSPNLSLKPMPRQHHAMSLTTPTYNFHGAPAQSSQDGPSFGRDWGHPRRRCSSCATLWLSPRINTPTTSLPRGRHHPPAQRTADVSRLHQLTFTEHSS